MNPLLRPFLINPFIMVFLLIPPIMIIGNTCREKRFSYWSLLLVFMIIGWPCVLFGIDWYYDGLAQIIDKTPTPPEEWLEILTADGAKRVFALFFGWLYSAIYFLVWLAATLVVPKMIKSIKEKS